MVVSILIIRDISNTLVAVCIFFFFCAYEFLNGDICCTIRFHISHKFDSSLSLTNVHAEKDSLADYIKSKYDQHCFSLRGALAQHHIKSPLLIQALEQ